MRTSLQDASAVRRARRISVWLAVLLVLAGVPALIVIAVLNPDADNHAPLVTMEIVWSLGSLAALGLVVGFVLAANWPDRVLIPLSVCAAQAGFGGLICVLAASGAWYSWLALAGPAAFLVLISFGTWRAVVCRKIAMANGWYWNKDRDLILAALGEKVRNGR